MWKQMRRNMIQIEGERSASLDLCAGRLSALGLFFMVSFMLIGLRAFDLGVVQSALAKVDVPYESLVSAIDHKKKRGNIYDRNGLLIATNIKSSLLYADPSFILEPESVARDLVKLFPDLTFKKILSDLKENNRFVMIRRVITPDEQQKVLALGQPGLGFEEHDRRIYPLGSAAGHLIGYTDTDGKGLSGIERSYNDQLSKGENIHVSLDMRIQHAVKRETNKAIQDFQGIAGAAIVMDAKTGEILAGVSLPDFDLNKASDYAEYPEKNKELLFNRLTLGVYELGSMFKIFSTAAFLETHSDGMSQAFDVRKPIKIGRFSINDFKGKKRVLSLPEVFIYSSNIGTANMGRMIGGEYLHGFYKDLGLLDPMTFDINEVGKPKSPVSPWKEVSVLTASYGHGLSTTPLQMTSAVAGIINGGFQVMPTLLAVKKENTNRKILRVLSDETSEKMRKLLRLTVMQGTGSKADVYGFSVGGKTGTAEKIVQGRYDHKKLISSFVSAFPMNDPKYVVMVMVDEPKPNKYSHGYATAGWVSAPAVARIVNSMASVLAIPADQYEEKEDIGLEYISYLQQPHDSPKIEKKKVMNNTLDNGGAHHVSY